MSGFKNSHRGNFETDRGVRTRSRHSHSVFEDSSCGMASHHRCTSVTSACSCDSVLETESTRHECACGHTHIHPAWSGVRESATTIDNVPQGVL